MELSCWTRSCATTGPLRGARRQQQLQSVRYVRCHRSACWEACVCVSSLRSIRRPLHQSPLRTACCLAFAARGVHRAHWRSALRGGCPRVRSRSPPRTAQTTSSRSILGEDAFFDVIIDRSEGFEQARFADENWPDPHGEAGQARRVREMILSASRHRRTDPCRHRRWRGRRRSGIHRCRVAIRLSGAGS